MAREVSGRKSTNSLRAGVQVPEVAQVEVLERSVVDREVDFDKDEMGGSRSRKMAAEVVASSSENPGRPKCACTVSNAEASASNRSRSATEAADAAWSHGAGERVKRAFVDLLKMSINLESAVFFKCSLEQSK